MHCSKSSQKRCESNAMVFFVFALSVAASFLFAGFETGFISWNHYKVEKRAGEGVPTAKLAMILQRNRAKVLTTVLVGNNIALVLMENSFSSITAVFGLVFPAVVQSLVLTLFVVFFCELLPKSLFRIYSFRLTYSSVPILIICFFLVYPVSILFEFVSRILTGKSRSEDGGGSAYALAYEGSRRDILPALLVPLLGHLQVEKSVHEFVVENKIPASTSVKELSYNATESTTIHDLVNQDIVFTVDQIRNHENGKRYDTVDILDALFKK